MPQQITLDQLMALNDEIAALARVGVPLDQGLLHLGGDLPGRLGAISRRIGERLAVGEPLTRVLDEEPGLPPAYRAVVAAGIRTGRLAVALEGMATLIRRSAEMRRTFVAALIYPVIVLGIAYGLFTFMLQKCFPVMEMGLRYFSPRGGAWRFFEVLRTSTPYWVPWLPWLLLISLGVWWYRSRRAASVETSSWRAAKATCYGGRPSFGSLLHAGRMSVFSDTLALLLEQDVPLHEAVVLGADASADRGLRASCRQLAERLRRGESVRGVPLAGTPPVLSWLLTGVPEKSRLIASLRRAAEAYRRHADWTLRCLSVYLPLWLTVAVGGTAVMLYALSVFGPWCRTLYDLSLPS